MKACPKCETLWDDGKRFCPYHGLLLTPVAEPAATAPPMATSTDAERTVRMSDEERAQLFTPQLPTVEKAAPGRLAVTVEIEDPPTTKSPRQATPAAPPVEFDPLIPPTVVVPRSALPSLQDMIASAVALPAEAVMPAGTSPPVSPVTSGLSEEASPRTAVAMSPSTVSADASSTVAQLELQGRAPGPSAATPPPPAALPEDDVGFILDLGEKTASHPPAPPAEEKPAPPEPRTPNLTPSSVPALVSPSPTVKRRTAVQYFKLFNERKKIIQQFVHGLDSKKVKVTEGHSNQEDHLMHRYDLAFRALGTVRTFPVVIILQRKPVYDLVTSVDLYEIAESPLLRAERTKSLGGECKSTPNGVIYHLSYGEDLPSEALGPWLAKTFQAIVALLPGADL